MIQLVKHDMRQMIKLTIPLLLLYAGTLFIGWTLNLMNGGAEGVVAVSHILNGHMSIQSYKGIIFSAPIVLLLFEGVLIPFAILIYSIELFREELNTNVSTLFLSIPLPPWKMVGSKIIVATFWGSFALCINIVSMIFINNQYASAETLNLTSTEVFEIFLAMFLGGTMFFGFCSALCLFAMVLSNAITNRKNWHWTIAGVITFVLFVLISYIARVAEIYITNDVDLFAWVNGKIKIFMGSGVQMNTAALSTQIILMVLCIIGTSYLLEKRVEC